MCLQITPELKTTFVISNEILIPSSLLHLVLCVKSAISWSYYIYSLRLSKETF